MIVWALALALAKSSMVRYTFASMALAAPAATRPGVAPFTGNLVSACFRSLMMNLYTSDTMWRGNW